MLEHIVQFEPCREKTCLRGYIIIIIKSSDQVLHKPICTTTEDGQRLELSRDCTIYYHAGDVRPRFRIYAKRRFSHDAAPTFVLISNQL